MASLDPPDFSRPIPLKVVTVYIASFESFSQAGILTFILNYRYERIV